MALKIAISGFSGCGNTTVSKLVAERLRCKFLNYTLRNLAVDMGKPFAEVQQQAEIDPSLDYAVDKKQAVFSASSKRVVVGSRLACWLDDRRVLSKLAVRKKPKESPSARTRTRRRSWCKPGNATLPTPGATRSSTALTSPSTPGSSNLACLGFPRRKPRTE